MKSTLMMVLALVFVTSSAYAAGSATLTVTADVIGSCSFSAAAATLDFANIDPSTGLDAIATQSSIDFNCTNGTAYTLVLPTTVTLTGPSTIAGVSLAYGAALTGTGTGVPSTITIDGTIPAANYATALVGAYSGNVTLSITP